MLNFLVNCYKKYTNCLKRYFSDALLLFIRVTIGLIFLKGGLVKFANIDSAILLFEYEYQLPFINPNIAAYLAMISEIFFGSLVIAGFFAPLCAVPLICMTLVIQIFVIQDAQHIHWLAMLATLVVYGDGRFSISHLLSLLYNKYKKYRG